MSRNKRHWWLKHFEFWLSINMVVGGILMVLFLGFAAREVLVPKAVNDLFDFLEWLLYCFVVWLHIVASGAVREACKILRRLDYIR